MSFSAVELVDDEICSTVRAAIETESILPVTSAARKILAAFPKQQFCETELMADLASAALAARVPIEVG